MNQIIAGLFERSTANGWLLCIIGIGGVITLLKILAAQRPKMKELKITEGTALREAFVSEMTALRDEIKGLRDETKDLRDETKDLRDENALLRREVRDLHGVIDGLRREALQTGLSTQRAVINALPRDIVPESTLAALDRIDPIPT